MKIRLVCTGGGLSFSPGKIPHLKWADGIVSLGFKFATGIMIEFKTVLFQRLLVISDPVSLTRGSGIVATLMGMEYFEVSDPPKNLNFVDIDRTLTDVEIEGRNHNLADIKITICDKLNQPLYKIEKYNVPYKGMMNGDFNVRGELIAKRTRLKVPRYDPLQNNAAQLR